MEKAFVLNAIKAKASREINERFMMIVVLG